MLDIFSVLTDLVTCFSLYIHIYRMLLNKNKTRGHISKEKANTRKGSLYSKLT